jgi:putative membrane protein
MLSEQRLHPASILFALGASVQKYALPGLVLLVGAGRSSGGRGGSFGYLPVNWELWLMLLLIPSAVFAVVRYLTYRLRYEGTELVIRTGFVFRNERHIPYARIQNLDAVQNLVHRALDVVEVRVETGGGREPEARISVVHSSALAEMRARVLEGRRHAQVATTELAEPEAARTILQLATRDLLLFGLLENRGIVLIGAAYGVAWELGLLRRFVGNVFEDRFAPYLVPTSIIESLATGGSLTLARVLVLLVGIAVLLVIVRLVSMAWAIIRLHGFQLTRGGEDLHTRFGLFTRVLTTIPLGRVQTLTIRQGPLHRYLKRMSVQVETAGGASPETGGGKREREWLAPIVHESQVAAVVTEVIPEVDLHAFDWQPPHPGAFRRVVKRSLLLTLTIVLLLATVLRAWALALVPLAIAWTVIAARKHVAHLAWASTDDVVVFRSGWLWSSMTVARIAKVQAVSLFESPFDRRTAMARVRVDTAGAGQASHRVDVPYLARETAEALHTRLAAQAAATTFR